MKTADDVIYLLYNGYDASGVRNSEHAAELAGAFNPRSYVVVGDTHVGQLFNIDSKKGSTLFMDLFDKALEKEVLGDRPISSWSEADNKALTDLQNKYLNGSLPDDGNGNFKRLDQSKINGGKGSFWDIASRKFVKENHGKFEAITNFWSEGGFKIIKDSIFGAEITDFLAKTDGSTLNGVSIKDLKKVGGFDEILKAVTVNGATKSFFT